MHGTFTEEGLWRKKKQNKQNKRKSPEQKLPNQQEPNKNKKPKPEPGKSNKRPARSGSSGEEPSKRTKNAKEKSSNPTIPPQPDPIVSPTLTKNNLGGGLSGDATPIPVSPPPPPKTTFTIARHLGLGAMMEVKLLPHIAIKRGAIAGISFGRNRTPSPFGNKMGDHTGSWASVVDSVHARLFGKDLPGALTELETMQKDAQAWMSQDTEDTAVGKRMWNLLDPADQAKRQPVLENYAFLVGDLTAKARGALLARGTTPDTQAAADTSAAELLAQAAAHHLAYLNFLPFATVPAKGGRSIGSGEGTARAKALAIELDVEADRQWQAYLSNESKEDEAARSAEETAAKLLRTKGETPDETKMREEAEAQQAAAEKDKQLADARDGLWGLFSMDAAVRTADLDRVVAPERIAKHLTQLKQLQALADTVSTNLTQFILKTDPPAEQSTAKQQKRQSVQSNTKKLELGQLPTKQQRRKSMPIKRSMAMIENFSADVGAWTGKATQLKKADLPYPEVQQLTTEVTNAVKHMQGVTEQLTPQLSDTSANYQKNIARMVGDLNKLIARLSVDTGTTREQSALLLAHLVHDHQVAVSRAYPNSVLQTRFLGDDPAVTAAKKVADFVTGRKGTFEWDPLDLLTEEIKSLYPNVGAKPAPEPDAARWVGDSRNASLVSAFNGEELSIQGRPPAPPGVEGMGSHATAWVVETDWVKTKLKLLKDGKKDIAAVLKSAALEELNGPLMTSLAHILPAEQLAGGQLGIIFDAAVDVLAATEPAEAVTAYLSFRNLLPYATVDAGIRAGHAERSGAKSSTVFDDTSMNAAIDQKLGELTPDRLTATIKTLSQVAISLQKDYDETADPAPVDLTSADPLELTWLTWKSNIQVKNAVERTIYALGNEVQRLEAAKNTKSEATEGVRDAIYKTRHAEHERVYGEAYPNRK